ncbi:hypothetical protein ACFFRR_011397 [Megaselia abdita]
MEIEHELNKEMVEYIIAEFKEQLKPDNILREENAFQIIKRFSKHSMFLEEFENLLDFLKQRNQSSQDLNFTRPFFEIKEILDLFDNLGNPKELRSIISLYRRELWTLYGNILKYKKTQNNQSVKELTKPKLDGYFQEKLVQANEQFSKLEKQNSDLKTEIKSLRKELELSEFKLKKSQTNEDKLAQENAKLREKVEVSEKILGNIQRDLIQVCGPVKTE